MVLNSAVRMPVLRSTKVALRDNPMSGKVVRLVAVEKLKAGDQAGPQINKLTQRFQYNPGRGIGIKTVLRTTGLVRFIV